MASISFILLTCSARDNSSRRTKNRAVSGQTRGQLGRSIGHKPQEWKKKNIILMDWSQSNGHVHMFMSMTHKIMGKQVVSHSPSLLPRFSMSVYHQTPAKEQHTMSKQATLKMGGKIEYLKKSR